MALILKQMCVLSLTIFMGYMIPVTEQNKVFFRNDYVRLGSSFYKFHNTTTFREEAVEACEMEGAMLFYPETEEEMAGGWADWAREEVRPTGKQNLHIGVLILNISNNEAITADNKTFNLSFEISTSSQKPCEKLCMYLHFDSLKLKAYNCFAAGFFCKKPKASVEWNEKCNMAKIPSDGNGKMLHESGYPMWAHTQPDGDVFEGFGAMAYNGRLHDIAPDAVCIFVCELDVDKKKKG